MLARVLPKLADLKVFRCQMGLILILGCWRKFTQITGVLSLNNTSSLSFRFLLMILLGGKLPFLSSTALELTKPVDVIYVDPGVLGTFTGLPRSVIATLPLGQQWI